MRSWIGFVVLILALLQVVLFSGCSVDADALRAPTNRPSLDAGFPDVVPGMDSVAAEAPRAASDSLPDAGLALEVRLPSLDTSPALDLLVLPDTRPAAPDLRSADVLPAPDLAPECPYVAWTRPNPSLDRWMFTVDAPATEICFTTCGVLNHLGLSQPSSRVKINGVATAPTWNENGGYMPGTAAAIDGLYVFRVSAGDPVTISVGGGPNNSTGACP